ncbi:hypothetical protein [Bartonella sp. DGB2]|uniref:hypothetical protein n=1 Tax=Bartonella sp. DGB2 TaxID=3388426 RepID=UPI00398FADE4
MSISILIPLIYLLLGVIVGRWYLARVDLLARLAAMVLTNIFIPIVSIYNILFHQPGIFLIMMAIVLIMIVMLVTALFVTRDLIKSLCFAFLNIGWLGLPVAVALYGDRVTMVMVAAYVGSSIFGNSVCTFLMMPKMRARAKFFRLLRSPVIISVIAGVALLPYASFLAHYDTQWQYIYGTAKFIMSFLGMFILGMWIAKTKWSDYQNIGASLTMSFSRLAFFSCLITFLVFYGYYADIALIRDNMFVFYFIGLLPPAANIIVLETYYLESGRSAAFISVGTLISIIFITFYAVFTVAWVQ